jgi:hypothetical protein
MRRTPVSIALTRPQSQRLVTWHDQWTELLSGGVHTGDTLVTNAMLRTGHRL